MKKRFNVAGLCVPEKHYMVDIRGRLEAIKVLVEDGAYFTINRARQYGKTTTLHALAKFLANEYLVVSLDFQALDASKYADGNIFSITFAKYFLQRLDLQDEEMKECLKESTEVLKTAISKEKDFSLFELFRYLNAICAASPKPVVLMIDEVDSAANNQVFLDFLSQLRNYYLERESFGTKTFQAVILAGVYDIKNLKGKLRPDEEHRVNSPWNIAADFDISMSFSKTDIIGMLKEYESDCRTGMRMDEMAGLLYDYTSGYPFLVSRLCKLMDEKISRPDFAGSREAAWTKSGFFEAERLLLEEKNTLFESLMGKLQSYPELDGILKSLLFAGTEIPYNAFDSAIEIAAMFGFIQKKNGQVAIANRIFETWLYNLYLSDAGIQGKAISEASQMDRNQFIVEGHLNMRRILEKFVLHYHELYKDSDEKFLEEMGRKLFLLYLRPIINGTGNYYIEARTRNLTRTDVIVDYRGEQYIVELKIWHGDEYNKRGEKQLAGYLDSYRVRKGYMLSFNFNRKKTVGVREIVIGDKVIVEAVV